MTYLVQMKVYLEKRSGLEARVRAAIRKSGGVMNEAVESPGGGYSPQHHFAFCIKDTRLLPRIVHSVEAVRGAAVVSVSEPRPLR